MTRLSLRTHLRYLHGLALLLPLATGGCQTDEGISSSADEIRNETSNGSSATSEEVDPCAEGRPDALNPRLCPISCDNAESCPGGSYCKQGTCTVDCEDDSECNSGTCGETGRCEFESEIFLDPKETDPDKNEEEDKPPPQCVEGQVEFQEQIPQVWLLLDRSSSMNSVLNLVTRWDAVGSVLLGDPLDSEDRGVVGDLEEKVAFGANFYTTGTYNGQCALALDSVALAANNYTAIRQRYNKLAPTGGTPTADAVAAVVTAAKRADLTGGKKILVLATDGAPGACQSRPDSATFEVEKEVTRAFQADIETFAISISTGTNAAHMQRVANLGTGLEADAEPPAPYYTAESEEDLKAAFSTIIEGVPRSCEFALNGTVDEENAFEGTVTLAGEELEYQNEDGWQLASPSSVELLGTACEQIQAGEEDLDITFPCSVFELIVR